VQFSQGQLRETLGISVETFRHWKRVLPPFAERERYTPRYSIGDLLAAGILHRLTDQCGVRVGSLTEISTSMLDICNSNSWTVLKGKTLVVDVRKRACRIQDSAHEVLSEGVVIVCPLRPIIAAVRYALSRQQLPIARQRLSRPANSIHESSARRKRA
jgi:hypothetical protein